MMDAVPKTHHVRDTKIRRLRPAKLLLVGLCAVLAMACMPKFPNIKGKLIRSSAVENLIAEMEPISVRSPDHYKAVYFRVNTQMRQCLADKPDVYRGYILDSHLDEEMERGELATLREKSGFGNRAETYVLFESGAEGTKIVIHTRESFQLEKWRKWIAGERGCFPELMG